MLVALTLLYRKRPPNIQEVTSFTSPPPPHTYTTILHFNRKTQIYLSLQPFPTLYYQDRPARSILPLYYIFGPIRTTLSTLYYKLGPTQAYITFAKLYYEQGNSVTQDLPPTGSEANTTILFDIYWI